MACLKCPRSMAVRTIRHAPAVILESSEAASARPARYTPVQRRCLLSLHDAGALFLFDACISRRRESRGDKRRSRNDGESLVSELHVVQPPRVDVDAVRLPTREQRISTMLSSLRQRRDRSCLVPHRRLSAFGARDVSAVAGPTKSARCTRRSGRVILRVTARSREARAVAPRRSARAGNCCRRAAPRCG
jgi:hypothetical protein